MEEFPEFEWAEEIPDEISKATVSAFLDDNPSENYAPPDLESLRYKGVGMSVEEAEQLQDCEQALLIAFQHPREEAFEVLRAAHRLVAAIVKECGGLPWDEGTRQVFSAGRWNEQRIESWTDGVPDVSDHINIHAYRDADYIRAITLGMQKFGLADVVIDELSWPSNRSLGHLMNALCQAFLEGAGVGPGGHLDLDFSKFANESTRRTLTGKLLQGATGKARLALKQGAWDIGDPVNSLIEISFERYEGPDLFRAANGAFEGMLRVGGRGDPGRLRGQGDPGGPGAGGGPSCLPSGPISRRGSGPASSSR